jgi:N-hydroxyarylamine O-acetyltransferase
MQLDAYFDRIGFAGTARIDLETLGQLHLQHSLSIPYENIDVQLGRPLDLDLERSFTKLVVQGRGGWCYEMNGLLGWALEEIGFEVMRMNGGVLQVERGEGAMGNHLVLCVQLDEPWIADVGLGDGPVEPYPLREHAFIQRGFAYRLEQRGDSWRFHNHPGSTAASFDFYHRPADEGLFARNCNWLSTDPESPFMKALVCQRVIPQGYEFLVGRVATRFTTEGREERLIDSGEELVQSLSDRFGLNVPEVADIWDKVLASHEAYLASKAWRPAP